MKIGKTRNGHVEKHSRTECPLKLITNLSQRWELNSRPLPYHGSALPLSYVGKWWFSKKMRTTVVIPSCWSERRGSNPRPSAWKADALPTELLPLLKENLMTRFSNFNIFQNYILYFLPPQTKGWQCGESRIRTCEDVVSRFTVCPRWPLEYLPNLILNSKNLDSKLMQYFKI